eukprot:TRINITY_DN9668_c0_g1_i1.p1 TRINITY_DN9668_c0_g1~~TRINITY_DN9668_c0_g1_i1.p1  ORF type:complete len:725 (-),score=183.93 TRINITY_DN9668_c0_g1_i1:6-2180(-)
MTTNVPNNKISNATSIEVFIDQILIALQIEQEEICLRAKSEWVSKLKKNLVYNVGLFKRLHPDQLSSLGLPIVLEEELEKLLLVSRERKPLLNLMNIGDIQIVSNHSKQQAVIQQREDRFRLTLSEEDKELLRKSWNKLCLILDPSDPKNSGLHRFSRDFYPTFFRINGAAERLFSATAMETQSKVLINMLTWIITNLDNMQLLIPTLAQMGGRHEIYGVKEDEYELFGKSVGETFKNILGNDFTEKDQKAWETCIVKVSQLMMNAAKMVVSLQGFRGKIYMEKGSSWVTYWGSLTVDTLYIFKNEEYTEFKCRYLLRCIDKFEIPKDKGVKFSISLECSNPSISIVLGFDDKLNWEDWVFELNWRIQAINRVYRSKLNQEEDSESSVVTDTDPNAIASRKIIKQITRTNNSIKQKQELQSTQKQEVSDTLLQISSTQKELIRSSWEAILKKEFITDNGPVTGLSRFFDLFYAKFFQVNPSGKRLFEEAGIHVQGRALVKMLAMIVKSLDNPSTLKNTLKNLGGRHEIYGVEPDDYRQFAIAICEVILTILGSSIFNNEVKDAWYITMMTLGNIMQGEGRKFKQEPFTGTLYYKYYKKDNSWKKTALSVSLDTLYIYKDEKRTKLRGNFALSEINEVSTTENYDFSSPTEFCFDIELASYRMPKISFAAEDEKSRSLWIYELGWRIQAVQRVYKEDEESVTEQSVSDKISSMGAKLLIGHKKKK